MGVRTSVSSAKPKAKSSVNKQVKAAIGAVKDFIAGHSVEAKPPDPEDKAARQVVAAELLAAMSRRDAGETSRGAAASESSGRDTREIPPIQTEGAAGSNAQSDSQNSKEQQRARQLFLDHGYFDDAVKDLRGANSPAERASAARALGLVGNQRATAHLIAAMFDDDPEVCAAAEEALAQIGDPNVASGSMSALVNKDLNSGQSKEAQASPAAQTATSEAELAKSTVQDRGEGAARSAGKTSEAGHAKSIVRDKQGRFVHAPPKSEQPQSARTTASSQDAPAAGKAEAPAAVITKTDEQEAPASESVADPTATREEEQLLLEEHAVRETVEQLEHQLREAATLRHELEREARLSAERETTLRAAAAARRREEEDLRRQSAEEAERLRVRESEALAAEQEARSQAESEARRLAEEEGRLWLEAASLRLAAEELARQRTEMERARREAAQAALHAEATRARQEAKSRHEIEVARLRSEEEGLNTAARLAALRRAEVEGSRQEAQADIERLKEEQTQLAAAEAARRTEAERLRRGAEERNRVEQEQLHQQLEELRHVSEEVASRRGEVQAAREKADAEAERLLEAQARMRASEEARNQAELERVEVEAAINRRVETERRLLEEARRHAQEEQQRLEEESRRHNEEEAERLAKLEVLRTKAEIEAKQRAEQEQHILSQIDSLRIGDSEARKRIEDAETRRRSAEEAYRLVADKVQRVETEAHLRSVEEEQMLAKLEAVRRSVAVEAQGRAEQEKRIKEEIEMFRRLEEEERPRLEAAILQRSAAEARLQQARDRLKAEEKIRQRSEEQQISVGEQSETSVEEPDERGELEYISDIVWQEPSRPLASSVAYQASNDLPENVGSGAAAFAPAVDVAAGKDVPPAISSYLRSVDPYKRAAAVSELARSHAKDAFGLIADCFEDHSPHVRNAAARALRILEPTRTVDLFNRALEEGSAERRRNIGSAIADSGLAAEAIDNLVSESREDTYNALSILFVMAKTGEVEPLVHAIEENQNDEISRAVIKLLTLSGQSDVAEAARKRRVNGRPGKK